VALLLVGRVVLRLGEVQVVQHEEWLNRARAEIDKQVTLLPDRGVITDRAGNVMAMDVDRESLWVVPALITPERAPKIALTLSAILNQDPQKLLTILEDRDRYWTPVARWLEPEVAKRIAALDEEGLRLIYEPRRVYPQGSMAAHVVGAVNLNGDGLGGVEAFYDTALKGITGTLKAEFDPAQRPIAIGPQQVKPARNGINLKLTIDPMVQYIAETELKHFVEKHQADGGSIIVMEVKTGAIRGMATWPPFDPYNYQNYSADVYGRNPAINTLYEPGSTFKMFTIAAGLQARAFTADTTVDDTGTTVRGGIPISNWNGVGNGALNADRVLYFSSNVGAIKLAEIMGPETFYQYVKAFGFGHSTGVDLGGEEAGIVHTSDEANFNDITLATNAFGQGISVTPLQMVAAAGALANDGMLMKPYIVEERCDTDNNCTRTEPVSRGQVVEPGVAWTVRRMMVNAANHYAPVVWAPKTGSLADQWLVPGYQVGAKTGTASIPLPGGGYDPNYTIGSVLGFAPAEDARYAVLVKIDRPKDDMYAVNTAIPMYYNVVDQLLRYERVPPDSALVSPGQQ
jgi:cell division protein FtsI (penicillin-binding protein 3)